MSGSPPPDPGPRVPVFSAEAREHLDRVRRICAAFPEAEERLSHGEPTFFVGGKVFVMFANNHHEDGHLAIWVPAPPGFQAGLIEESSGVYFRPAYVGHRGWVGIELPAISDEDLEHHIDMAWHMIAPKRLHGSAPLRPGRGRAARGDAP